MRCHCCLCTVRQWVSSGAIRKLELFSRGNPARSVTLSRMTSARIASRKLRHHCQCPGYDGDGALRLPSNLTPEHAQHPARSRRNPQRGCLHPQSQKAGLKRIYRDLRMSRLMLAFMASSMICGPALGQAPKAQRGRHLLQAHWLSATPSVGLRQVHSVSRHLSESCTSGIRSRILPIRLRKAL